MDTWYKVKYCSTCKIQLKRSKPSNVTCNFYMKLALVLPKILRIYYSLEIVGQTTYKSEQLGFT